MSGKVGAAKLCCDLKTDSANQWIELKCIDDAKRFTFCITHKINAAAISQRVEPPYEVILPCNGGELDGLELCPSVRFSCTNPKINAFDAEDLLGGWFVEHFQCIDYDLTQTDELITINSTFILQFDTDIPISLQGDEIIYVEEDQQTYAYKVTPSFCKHGYSPLTVLVEINCDNSIRIEQTIQEYLMP